MPSPDARIQYIICDALFRHPPRCLVGSRGSYAPPALRACPPAPLARPCAPRAFGALAAGRRRARAAIVIVGGITRLTELGLSITEWKPIRGVIPPLNAAEWQAEFAGYKRIPQYDAFNAGMTLDGFKHIYFWEYLHRLLARGDRHGAGVCVLLGFWWRRAIPQGYGWRLRADLRARRAAGRDRLVDGRLGPASIAPRSAISASPPIC